MLSCLYSGNYLTNERLWEALYVVALWGGGVEAQ